MITFFAAVLLGIVEGLTEFLPISSTAHLILTNKLLGIEQSDFVKTFEVAIQGGAICAVLLLYWKKFFNLEILKKIIAAFIPTAVIGFVLYELIKGVFFESTILILLTLLIGGIVLLFFESWVTKEEKELQKITYKESILIGLTQAIAVIPGVSRSGATIVGGRLLGLSREAIVEFSFLLAVPTILAATLFELLKNYELFKDAEFTTFGIGFIVSFITAILSIKFFLRFIQKHSFKGFGIYRIVLAIVLFIFFYL